MPPSVVALHASRPVLSLLSTHSLHLEGFLCIIRILTKCVRALPSRSMFLGATTVAWLQVPSAACHHLWHLRLNWEIKPCLETSTPSADGDGHRCGKGSCVFPALCCWAVAACWALFLLPCAWSDGLVNMASGVISIYFIISYTFNYAAWLLRDSVLVPDLLLLLLLQV